MSATDPHAGQTSLRGERQCGCPLALIRLWPGGPPGDAGARAASSRSRQSLDLPHAAGHNWYPYSFRRDEKNEPGHLRTRRDPGLVEELTRAEWSTPDRTRFCRARACARIRPAPSGCVPRHRGLSGGSSVRRDAKGLHRFDGRHPRVFGLQRHRRAYSCRTGPRIIRGVPAIGGYRRRADLSPHGPYDQSRRTRRRPSPAEGVEGR